MTRTSGYGRMQSAGWTKTGPGACQTDGTNCRSLPRLGTGLFEIPTPQADYDPIRASAGAMIASAARSIGLNVVSKPTAFGTIVAATNAHDFDMFILGWRIGGTDPDYLFSFFHSSNALSGQNYQGFYDSAFDAVISKSRKELNEAKRQSLIKEAQGILAQRLPYDVLYYRRVIEAERQDRFENYSVASGTFSATYTAPSPAPANPDIDIIVTARSPNAEVSLVQRTYVVRVFAIGVPFLSITPKLTTGDLVPVSESLVFGVDVRDEGGNLSSAATVVLTVAPSGPNINPASGTAAQLRSGIVFQAPAVVTTSPTTYTVTATATQAGYTQATSSIQFTVVKLTSPFTCPDGTVVQSGQPCPKVSVPALDVLPILGAIGAAAVVYGILRNRKKGA